MKEVEKKQQAESIIILHGWGLRGSKYDRLSDLLENKEYKVYSPDLPGFGSEPLTSLSMNLDNYIDFLAGFIKKNKISKPILIGHSFGGRVAIKYAFMYPDQISKLILTGVPIIRISSVGKKMARIAAAIGSKVFIIFPFKIKEGMRKILYFSIGEWDYYKAGNLRKVFQNIISEDLIQYIKGIKVPTLLVWGSEDKITPIGIVYRTKKINPSVKYQTVSGVGHRLPYEKPEEFYQAAKSFL